MTALGPKTAVIGMGAAEKKKNKKIMRVHEKKQPLFRTKQHFAHFPTHNVFLRGGGGDGGVDGDDELREEGQDEKQKKKKKKKKKKKEKEKEKWTRQITTTHQTIPMQTSANLLFDKTHFI